MNIESAKGVLKKLWTERKEEGSVKQAIEKFRWCTEDGRKFSNKNKLIGIGIMPDLVKYDMKMNELRYKS